MSDHHVGSVKTSRLLARARRGNRRAQAELLTSVQHDVFRFCVAQLGDVEIAREATQETALRTLAGLKTYHGSSQLKTWILGIALNVCREHRRDEARAGVHSELALVNEQPTMHPTPEETAVASEHVRRIQDLLCDLSSRQREVVVLRYFEELSVKDTADALGVAPGTVKATLSQALRRLRKRWIHHEQIQRVHGRCKAGV